MSPAYRRAIGSLLTVAFVLVGFVALYATARYFRAREEGVRSENPIVFCNPQNVPPEQQKCFFTSHLHVFPEITVFGEKRPLPFEKGDLTKHHTHAQLNKVHWHALLEVDPLTKEPPEAEFTLGRVFDDFGIYFAEDGILDHRVGETNPQTGQPATLRVLVNGEPNDQFRDAVWKDHDRVEVILE